MSGKIPECIQCRATATVSLFWSKHNKANILMKTYFCKRCAKNFPGLEPVKK